MVCRCRDFTDLVCASTYLANNSTVNPHMKLPVNGGVTDHIYTGDGRWL